MAEIDIKPLEELPSNEKNSTLSYSFAIDANTYNNISYEDFFNNHLIKNTPCIIKNVGADWEATKKWETDGKINYDYLSNQYGNLIVPVIDCKNICFDSQPRTEMKFCDYITYWKNNERDKLLYLKDWHLRRSRPDDKFYTVPEIFASDWLNEYAQDTREDDFMFVYMGPSDSWTAMHADVFSSFSWSVNVTGRKKWLLFPPGEEEKLMDQFNNVILRFEPEKYKDKDVVYYEIVQGKGDAIFVPSGWFHQVDNEVDTISINHNWVNGCNITAMWQSLSKILESIEQEIEDLKDLEEFPITCQNMLKHLYGTDCEAFANLIAHIGEKRLAQLEGGSNIVYNNNRLGKNHCMFDLKGIHDVITMMTQHPSFINNDYAVTEKFLVVQDCLTYIF